ncbi:hypothetical protein FGIG_01708 [Fasciola gigantica]|uniref:Uncharacterized protein n=1 Tax=Fasciola gigantica TaxID=46835 RepID=A0A504Y989_FASGI|nr:hypothetical protein FGIG_01708 [Fasciola gigantica]
MFTELMDSSVREPESLNVNYVANVVQSMELPNYPPGGFITKRGFVEGLYDVRIRQNDWPSQSKESRVQ